MPNKFINLFFREARFGWRGLVIFILVFLSVYSWNKISMSSAELKKVEQEKILISSISAMERELKAVEGKQLSSRPDLTEAMPAISGILILNNSPVALVGDNFLQEGDSIGQYVIFKITEHKVILTDQVTKLTKEINF